MRYLALLLFVSLFFTACGEDASIAEAAAKEIATKAQEKAYETMMEGHDRIMPLMGQLTAAQRSINEELKSDDGVADDRKEILTAANEQIEDAGDQMMAWMGNMKPLDKLREDMDHEAIMTYIAGEGKSIVKVESAMKAAIAAGKEVVGETHSHEAGGDHSGHSH